MDIFFFLNEDLENVEDQIAIKSLMENVFFPTKNIKGSTMMVDVMVKISTEYPKTYIFSTLVSLSILTYVLALETL